MGKYAAGGELKPPTTGEKFSFLLICLRFQGVK